MIAVQSPPSSPHHSPAHPHRCICTISERSPSAQTQMSGSKSPSGSHTGAPLPAPVASSSTSVFHALGSYADRIKEKDRDAQGLKAGQAGGKTANTGRKSPLPPTSALPNGVRTNSPSTIASSSTSSRPTQAPGSSKAPVRKEESRSTSTAAEKGGDDDDAWETVQSTRTKRKDVATVAPANASTNWRERPRDKEQKDGSSWRDMTGGSTGAAREAGLSEQRSGVTTEGEKTRRKGAAIVSSQATRSLSTNPSSSSIVTGSAADIVRSASATPSSNTRNAWGTLPATVHSTPRSTASVLGTTTPPSGRIINTLSNPNPAMQTPKSTSTSRQQSTQSAPSTTAAEITTPSSPSINGTTLVNTSVTGSVASPNMSAAASTVGTEASTSTLLKFKGAEEDEDWRARPRQLSAELEQAALKSGSKAEVKEIKKVEPAPPPKVNAWAERRKALETNVQGSRGSMVEVKLDQEKRDPASQVVESLKQSGPSNVEDEPRVLDESSIPKPAEEPSKAPIVDTTNSQPIETPVSEPPASVGGTTGTNTSVPAPETQTANSTASGSTSPIKPSGQLLFGSVALPSDKPLMHGRIGIDGGVKIGKKKKAKAAPAVVGQTAIADPEAFPDLAQANAVAKNAEKDKKIRDEKRGSEEGSVLEDGAGVGTSRKTKWTAIPASELLAAADEAAEIKRRQAAAERKAHSQHQVASQGESSSPTKGGKTRKPKSRSGSAGTSNGEIRLPPNQHRRRGSSVGFKPVFGTFRASFSSEDGRAAIKGGYSAPLSRATSRRDSPVKARTQLPSPSSGSVLAMGDLSTMRFGQASYDASSLAGPGGGQGAAAAMDVTGASTSMGMGSVTNPLPQSGFNNFGGSLPRPPRGGRQSFSGGGGRKFRGGFKHAGAPDYRGQPINQMFGMGYGMGPFYPNGFVPNMGMLPGAGAMNPAAMPFSIHAANQPQVQGQGLGQSHMPNQGQPSGQGANSGSASGQGSVPGHSRAPTGQSSTAPSSTAITPPTAAQQPGGVGLYNMDSPYGSGLPAFAPGGGQNTGMIVPNGGMLGMQGMNPVNGGHGVNGMSGISMGHMGLGGMGHMGPMAGMPGMPGMPIAPAPMPQTHVVGLDPLRFYVLGQVEYYFSMQNLAMDFFLRQQMDTEGWIDISMISSFNRIRSLTPDPAIVKEVMLLSSILEVRDEKVRLDHGESKRWVLPDAKLSPFTDDNSDPPSNSTGRTPAGQHQHLQSQMRDPQQLQADGMEWHLDMSMGMGMGLGLGMEENGVGRGSERLAQDVENALMKGSGNRDVAVESTPLAGVLEVDAAEGDGDEKTRLRTVVAHDGLPTNGGGAEHDEIVVKEKTAEGTETGAGTSLTGSSDSDGVKILL